MADLEQALTLLRQLVTNDEKREQQRCQKVQEYNLLRFDPNEYCWSHG